MIEIIATIGVIVAAGVGAWLIVLSRAVLTVARHWIATALLLLPFLAVALYLIGVPLPWKVAAVGGLWIGVTLWKRYLRTADVVTRWGERARRKAGVASAVDVVRSGSTLAVRRQAVVVRPSLVKLGRWARWTTETSEVAVRLARAGAWRVWASVEDVVMVFGAPRTGKSGWIAARIVDSPGACLVTSTRTDLLDLTYDRRARRGPVYVFNPTGLGGLDSTFRFDPLTECEDPVLAFERATDFMSVTGINGSGDRAWWGEQAQATLAALLHAAALGGLSMRDILRWVSEPAEYEDEVVRLLRRSPEASAFVPSAEQFLGLNDKTQTSITASIMPALRWLTNPHAAAATKPGLGLSVAELLSSRATVYLLSEKESQCAPLIAALTGHIAREARRIAAYQPGGRLDPPLRLCLDEAALLSPPLDSWTSDMGGRGVTIIAAFQSRAQMLERWGENGTAAILNNTAAIMVFGGTKDKADLGFWSHLAGDRDEPVPTLDERGRVKSRSTRKAPVIAPPQFANLPKWKVVVFRRGMPVVVAKARMTWQPTPLARLSALLDTITGAIVDQPAPELVTPWKVTAAMKRRVRAIPVEQLAGELFADLAVAVAHDPTVEVRVGAGAAGAGQDGVAR